MVRPLARTVRHLLTAVCLLVGVACAVEVALRVDRVLAAKRDRAGQPTLVVPSPVCYAELKPLVRIERNGRTLQTSSFGTRGPEPAVPKPDGTLRLLVLGDESTLALDAEREQTFAAAIEATLAEQTGQPVEVVNAAVPGGCPLVCALQYRHRLAALDADAVLLVLEAGDVVDDLRVRPHLRTDDDGRPVACAHPATRSVGPTWQSELIVADAAIRQATLRWLTASPAVRSDTLCPKRRLEWIADPDAWATPLVDMLGPVRLLRDDAVAGGATFHLAAVPIPVETRTGQSNPWTVVGRFALAEGIDWIDAGPGFARQSQPESLFAPPSGCDRPLLSPRGHALLGQAIAAHLLGRR